MSYKTDFIEFMVRSGVLTFGDFTAKSGRKTPYFVNTGNYKTAQMMSKLGGYYAAAIMENMKDKYDFLFGPAYKGIPLAVSAAVALYRDHNVDVPYCFNRKEEKDHGEGGSIVAHKPVSGQRALVIEDVITAGTAMRETIDLFSAFDNVSIAGVIISVDRMERGTGDKSAIQELQESHGIITYSIVNSREIMEHLHNLPVDGKVHIDDEMYKRMGDYLEAYGVK